jgi:hypothetical protein
MNVVAFPFDAAMLIGAILIFFAGAVVGGLFVKAMK